MSYYRPDNIIVKKSHDREYVFEFYQKDNRYLAENDSEIVLTMKEITRDGWGEPGDLAVKWFKLIDLLILVKEDGIVKGFVIANRLHENLIALIATVVTRDKQSSGLGSLLNTLALRDICFKRLKKNILKLFSPLYFVFRTPNPKLFSIAVHKLNVYPNLKGLPPSKKQLEVFDSFINLMSPNALVDRDNFVAKNTLAHFPDLIYSENNIPWSDNSKIDDFFKEKVKLLEREGNTLVVVGMISLRDALLNLKKIL